MNYTGEKCVLCKKSFTEEDDIVVCPECGSPHHRGCYKIGNKCANELLHAEGAHWTATFRSTETEPFQPEKEKAAEFAEAPKEAAQETEAFGIPRPYLGFDPNEDMGGAPLKDVSDFVRTNTIYYIPIFKRMKDTGRSLSFNLLSFIFPPIYFANRKMWFWAIASLVISVLLTMPLAVSYIVADGIENGYSLFTAEMTDAIYAHRNLLAAMVDICNLADMLIRIGFCLFANKLYFRFVLRSVKRIRACGGEGLTSSDIAAHGGIKPMNTILIVALSAAATFVSMYATIVILRMML